MELSEVSGLEAGRGVFVWEMEDRRIDIPERSSGIELLHILEAHVPSTSLAPFIGLFRALKALTYGESLRKFRRWRRGIPVVDYALLARASSAHPSTLQPLRLDQFESGISLKLVVQITPMDPRCARSVDIVGGPGADQLTRLHTRRRGHEPCIDHLLPSGM